MNNTMSKNRPFIKGAFKTKFNRKSVLTTSLMIIGMLVAIGTVTVPVLFPKQFGVIDSNEDRLKIRRETLERVKNLKDSKENK